MTIPADAPTNSTLRLVNKDGDKVLDQAPLFLRVAPNDRLKLFILNTDGKKIAFSALKKEPHAQRSGTAIKNRFRGILSTAFQYDVKSGGSIILDQPTPLLSSSEVMRKSKKKITLYLELEPKK